MAPRSNSSPIIPEKLGGKPLVKSRYPDYSHKFKRANVPQRGLPGWALWLGLATMFVNGFYLICKNNKKNQCYNRETREHTMALFPYRQAEADTMMLGKLNAQKKYEAEVMKDIKGWVPGESVYSSRWVAPNKKLHEHLDTVDFSKL